jgi:Tfp pilus assembly protein PilX
MVELKIAASNLVNAHRKLAKARRAMQEAEAGVQNAEHVFLTECGAREFGVATAALCEGHLLRVKEDYYECKKGEQVEVTAVQVIE